MSASEGTGTTPGTETTTADGTGDDGARIREAVRERYGGIARAAGATDADAGEEAGCGCGPSCSGGGSAATVEGVHADARALAREIGYSDDELEAAPETSNLGLGCGNPVALAGLEPGEVVLDLGAGAGFDAFLAAERVGPEGRVIGVDMTPEMVERARENAADAGHGNVDFRLGEIEALPVGDATVDAIISNCVINLSADRPAVFREAMRVLRPGGRLMISDLVTDVRVPETLRSVMELVVSCLPVERDRYLAEIEEAGFREVEVVEEGAYPAEALLESPGVREKLDELGIAPETAVETARVVRSARIRAVKPA